MNENFKFFITIDILAVSVGRALGAVICKSKYFKDLSYSCFKNYMLTELNLF